MDKIEDRELRRNGEGYWDPTAYKAIKRADAEMEGRANSHKKRTKKPATYNVSSYEKGRGMSLKQYKKWKLKVLSELCLDLSNKEIAYLNSLGSEAEIDAYAHKLIMNKE